MSIDNNLITNNNDLIRYFRSGNEISAVYLFGSFAEGRQNSMSDIDLGFLFFKDKLHLIDYNYMAELQVDLVKLLDFEDIDTVILNNREPMFLYSVLTEGTLIYYIDTEEFTDFLYESQREYLDFLPVYRFWEESYYGK